MPRVATKAGIATVLREGLNFRYADFPGSMKFFAS
jgi:hypothetical protein